MNRSLLMQFMADPSECSNVRALSENALHGDPVAFAMLQDAREEEGKDRLLFKAEVGKCYLVRTVTYFYLGRLKEQSAVEFIFDDCAWIPSTGRFSEALESGKLEEIEPYPKKCMVAVMTAAIVDYSEWKHPWPAKS